MTPTQVELLQKLRKSHTGRLTVEQKEPLMSLLIMGFVIIVQPARAGWVKVGITDLGRAALDAREKNP